VYKVGGTGFIAEQQLLQNLKRVLDWVLEMI
jgi:hypothetical protein